MNHRTLIALPILCLLPTVVRAADWQPAKGPLLTRWVNDVKPDAVLPDYPRPTLQRDDWQSLNGLWQFAIAKAGDEPPLGRKLDEQILVPFPVESALSGLMKRADRLWYRRTFTVPKDWTSKRLLLHFDASNWETTVWVNGQKFDSHRGGYDRFSFDITSALKKEGEQELVVRVWNPVDAGTQPRGKQVRNPGGIYYTPCTGIWQTVWLEPVPEGYLDSIKIEPNLEKKELVVSATVKGQMPKPGVTVKVFEGDREVAWKRGPIADQGAITLEVANPQAWSPEKPFLYRLEITLDSLSNPGRPDRVRSYAAFRSIAIGKDDQGITRILLNGKPYFQVGPLDQGYWPDGIYTAPTEAALKYDIEITKELGFNMIRKHVKVEPERWYHWCDKLGILVWQDMPSGDRSVNPGKGEITRTPESARQYELELQRMIDGRFNHPCIVMWVVFNEGWGQFDTARISAWTKKHDPSRLVNGASGWNDMKCADVHDIHVYPGPGSPQPEPARAAVLGEFGGLGLPVKGHMWSEKHWGYQGTRDGAELTRKYETLLRRVYQLKDKPGLSAAVYTQTTDVETEANGLLTYDRAVLKIDKERVAAANRGDFSRVPVFTAVVPTSQTEAQTWRYTLEKPADGWFKSDFEDASWKEGPGGFGTKGTPGAVVRTEWKSADIWLRRTLTLPEAKLIDPQLRLHHDEDAEIYINGVLAAKVPGFTTDYEEVAISPEAKAALRPGKNVIAVRCHQTTGGQYIDVGIVDVKK